MVDQWCRERVIVKETETECRDANEDENMTAI